MFENNDPKERKEEELAQELSVAKEAILVKEETFQLVVFKLSKEWYGVDIASVKEVIKAGKITYLPSSPNNIIGIINLRGNILSVTDLKKILGLPEEGLTGGSRIVVVESGNLETGFLVDEVDEVSEWSMAKVEPTLATIASEKADYIKGECRIGYKLIGILKVDKILEKH